MAWPWSKRSCIDLAITGLVELQKNWREEWRRHLLTHPQFMHGSQAEGNIFHIPAPYKCSFKSDIFIFFCRLVDKCIESSEFFELSIWMTIAKYQLIKQKLGLCALCKVLFFEAFVFPNLYPNNLRQY